MEEAWRVLLGLLARVISRGEQCRVGRSMVIFFVCFPPLCGGALVLVLAFGLASGLASIGAWQERRLLEVLVKGPWS